MPSSSTASSGTPTTSRTTSSTTAAGRTGPTYSIEATALRKRYGETQALDGLDLAVPRGSVYGLLGPNGAGKTTAVRILATLVRMDSGQATVGGVDVNQDPRGVRRRIGLTGQTVAIDEILTARQNLTMFGRLFHLSKIDAVRRAEELLAQFSLADDAGKAVKGFSGGMKRRLDLAASMILAPEVLFLDEPTTGLDPRGRSEVWDAIRRLAAGGTTVLLTTHYLDEADKLSDRIALVDRGRVIIEDTPSGLKRAIGGDQVEVVLTRREDIPAASAVVTQVTGTDCTVDEEALRIYAPVTDRVAELTQVARSLQDNAIEAEDLGLRRPTLDEVFLRLTGRPAGEDEPDAATAAGRDDAKQGANR